MKKILLSVFLVTASLQGQEIKHIFPLENESEEMMPKWFWPWGSETEEKVSFNLENVLDLEDRLNQKIIGQENAVNITSEAILRYAAGLNDDNGPCATLLFIGPTGVGKTELAKQLAKELLANQSLMLHFNMSEFSEEWTITRMIGSAPGYIDSEKGGQLTNPLMENPYSIVLLDEFDKAHPKVQKLFLQAFDEGIISTAMGQKVDCHNVIFIMSSNFAHDDILFLHKEGYSAEDIKFIIEPHIMSVIAPELYNRVEPVVFLGLNQESFVKIVDKFLKQLYEKVLEKKGIQMCFDSSIVNYLIENGYHSELGARPLKRLIEKDLVTVLAKALIQGQFHQGDKLKITYHDGIVSVAKFVD